MEPIIEVFGLVVNDMPTTLAFYRKLGLEIPAEADAEEHVEYVFAGGVRLCFDITSIIKSFDAGFVPGYAGRASLGILLDSPAEVDARYSELVGAGYHGHLEPWDAFWLQRYAVVHDPDGFTVDLFAPLPT